MAKDSKNSSGILGSPSATSGQVNDRQGVVAAELKVQLLVNDQLVVSSSDGMLWQDVLAAITGRTHQLNTRPTTPHETQHVVASKDAGHQVNAVGHDGRDENTHAFSADVVKFSKDIGASPEEVVAACSPQDESPYLSLDHHAWEGMKSSTPSKGPNAMAAIIPAATLLVLWFKQKKLGNPTIKQAQAVLKTIDLRDGNPGRSLKTHAWLQLKDDKIALNPARSSEAVRLARAFCTQSWGKE